MGKERKNTRSTLSKTEEPNSSQHHDDIPLTQPPTATPSPGAAKGDDGEDPVLCDLAGATDLRRRPTALRRLRSDMQYTEIYDYRRHTVYAVH